MNITWRLAFLVLLPLASCSDRASHLPSASTQSDSAKTQKSDHATEANKVFRSTDGGQTWENIGEGLPGPVKDKYGDSRNSFFADDKGLYLTAGTGIYHNEPNAKGPFWKKDIIPNEHSSIAPGKAGIYAYNFWGEGIFQKTNGTGVWSPVFTNFQANRVLNVFETAGGTVFIVSDRGLFKSTNNGQSWKPLPSGAWGKIVESNGVLLATSQRGILRSADDGETWALVISEGGVGVDVERIKDGFAAITYSTAAKTRRIRTSSDGGQTWQAIDAGLMAPGFIDPPLPPVTATPTAQQLSDSGWHPKDNYVPTMPTYFTTIVQVGEDFFCGHTYGIYKSSDKGKTWKLVRCAEKGKMFNLFVSGNVIYAIQTESHC